MFLGSYEHSIIKASRGLQNDVLVKQYAKIFDVERGTVYRLLKQHSIKYLG